ncbi:restriction endonuclease subunit S [Pseudomonas seleniipraecipitans]|uniref:Restriction endonuclease subunit S n=1 Tax=Phytopseudomonas seleniipraecipitans TaxID=640205 RepID=A0ABY5J2P5_9GAMM|nr:restriction endonuclease subunit S [Pseudomonas seleniipraecipitans]UUD62316.1 restriction endonuclease subunit S [Pseudomonas seleniipraecipitans]
MSAEVRPGYKQRELGVIPESWELVSLKDLGTSFKPSIKAGPFGSSLTKASYVSEGYKVYGQEQVIRGDHTYGDYFISKAKFNELVACSVSPGDILISLVGTAGKLIVLPDDAALGVINPRLLRLSFDKGRVCPLFFKSLFETTAVQAYLERYAQGGTMGVLNAGVLRPIVIALPSLNEQAVISKTLSDIEALICSLDQMIAKKRDIQQAAMQQLLTGQGRLPGFSGEWKNRSLGDIANIKTGSKNNQDKVEDGEYPFYVRSATVERINSFSHDCEAILVPGEGNIGSIFHYIDGRFDVHQRVYAITQFASDVSGKYIHLFMSVHFGAHAMQNSVKATVDSLRLPTFQVFKVLLPPTKEEQIAIANILHDIESELAILEARRDKALQLKQGMMQELLTGRIRLV